MRTFYMIPMLVFMLLTQVTMLMAQGNKPENVPTSVYGTYQGEATTEITNDKGTTKGAKKQLKIEISKGENGYSTLLIIFPLRIVCCYQKIIISGRYT